jgi:signal transduction histidine kinase
LALDWQAHTDVYISQVTGGIRINWLQVLLRGAQVLLFCAVITAFTTLAFAKIWPDGYLHQLVYAVCIGVPYWLVTEFGRLLVLRAHRHGAPSGGSHGWPKGWRGAALATVGIVAGLLFGEPLAIWLFNDVPYMQRNDHILILLFTVTTGVAASFYFHAQDAQAALQAKIIAAERDAVQARLMLLRSQLEPHMLFNTLANLRALIGVDPAAALNMLDRMDGFLRASLKASRATAHPLAAEFDRLRDYLALMSIRMGPRLTYALDLPDALRTQPVPPLLLQPLVENSIRHGLEPRAKGGRIEVSAAREGDTLRLTVRDTGVGFDADQPKTGRHFGLGQVIERVASADGGRGQVQVQSEPGNGTTIHLTLPCHTPP